MMNLHIEPAVEDRVLNIEGATDWLNAHGFPYKKRQVQDIATHQKLPFFRGPDGHRLFIHIRDLKKLLASQETAKKVRR